MPRGVAAGLTALCALAIAVAPASARSKPRGLRTFASCDGLVSYAQRAAIARLPRGGVSVPHQQVLASSGESSDDVSGTNVQEQGIDEPDLVKASGRYVFTVVAGARVDAVDARGERPRLLGSLPLEGYDHQLLLHGDRLLVLSQSSGPPDGRFASIVTLSEVDVSDPAAMRVRRTLQTEGRLISAREHGRTARVAITSYPRGPDPVPLDAPEQYYDRARAAVQATGVANWLPTAKLKNRRTGRVTRRTLVDCRRVRHPIEDSGTSTLTILTIDLEQGLPAVDADAIMADGDAVYASATGLYVATARWQPVEGPLVVAPATASTTIHKFDTSDPHATTYRGSGEVRGTLLSQFALSEHDGVLRAATTDTENGASESFVTTLAERDGRLAELGRVGGLGRGESIYAVRFLGARGYVVTFRRTDPLYTVDLADPRAPRVAGELKIPGYSAYLHPVGDDLLLGVGQDADEAGRVRGAQVSLFDVSDPAAPRRIDQRPLGEYTWSEVEHDHHAFLFWAPRGLAVIPVTLDGGGAGAVGIRVAGRSLEPAGLIEHPNLEGPDQIRRSVVVGERLLTLSARGVRASRLDGLTEESWLALPAPEPISYPGPISGPVVVG